MLAWVEWVRCGSSCSPPSLGGGAEVVPGWLRGERVWGEEGSGDPLPQLSRAWRVCACGKTCGFLRNLQLVLVARRSRMLAASPGLGGQGLGVLGLGVRSAEGIIDYTLRESL